jgi:transposase InsO family protein
LAAALVKRERLLETLLAEASTQKGGGTVDNDIDNDPPPPPQSFVQMQRVIRGRPPEDSTDSQMDEAEVADRRKRVVDDYITALQTELSKDFSSTETQQVVTMLRELESVLQAPDDAFSPVPDIFHDVELVDGACPVRIPLRRAHPKQIEVELKEVRKMLKLGVIEKCESPWSSPILIVPKKNPGEWRFAIDYRQINKLTVPSAYALPRLDDALSAMHGAKMFTSLDCASAFWSVELTERTKNLSAFNTHGMGQMRFTRMPYGLSNSPATFQRLMDLACSGLHWKSVLTYLDDILIFSPDFGTHLTDVREVLERVKRYNLHLRPDKCRFFKSEVPYLGHVITGHGVKLDEKKVEALEPLLNAPPTAVKEIRTFLGMTSYFRNYIPRYATIAEPLIRLTKQSGTLQDWGEPQIQAVAKLKQLLSSAPVLAFPDFDTEFQVATDASDFGIGAVISQIHNGSERVIAYASRTLTPRERKWDTFEREGLAIVWATRKFRNYLFGSKFTLHTDHQALQTLWAKTSPPRLLRWVVELQGWDFFVKHRPGKANGPPDCLSRMPMPPPPFKTLFFAQSFMMSDDSTHEDLPGSGVLPFTDPQVLANIGQLQKNDPFCAPIIDYVTNGTLPDDDDLKRRIISLCQIRDDKHQVIVGDPKDPRRHRFYWNQGALYRKAGKKYPNYDQLVIPATMIESVLWQTHGGLLAGHLGVHKTMSIIEPRFFWPKMRTSVRAWIGACLCCQRRKRPRPKAGLTQDISVTKPFDTISLDFCGPFRETPEGNRWILTITDFFSRWPICIPVPNQSAEVLVDALVKHVVTEHGIPKRIVTDLGKSLSGRVMKRFCARMGIARSATTAYQPTSNGRGERFHKYMNAALTPFVDQHPNSWDRFLHLIEFPYRVSELPGIGFSPFQMLFGRQPTLPVDLLTGGPQAEEELAIDKHMYGLQFTQKMADLYKQFASADDKYRAKFQEQRDKSRFDITYKPGDRILHWSPPRPTAADKAVDRPKPDDPEQFTAAAPFNKKFHYQWNGPHTVEEQVGPVSYMIRLSHNNKLVRTHVNRMSAYVPFKGKILQPPLPTPIRPPSDINTDSNTIQVGSIVIIDNPNDDAMPFWIGRTVDIQGTDLVVHWLGNPFDNVRGTFRPSWRNEKDLQFFSETSGGHAKPYLNTLDKLDLNVKMVICHSFELNANLKLPMRVLKFLSTSPRVNWSLFEPQQSESEQKSGEEEVKTSSPPDDLVTTAQLGSKQKSGGDEQKVDEDRPAKHAGLPLRRGGRRKKKTPRYENSD